MDPGFAPGLEWKAFAPAILEAAIASPQGGGLERAGAFVEQPSLVAKGAK